jgi:hypothetical protein
MLYLLDANVLITAHNLCYPIDGVPEFWAWLVHKGGGGDLKMPLESYEDVKDGSTDRKKTCCSVGPKRRGSGCYPL